MHYVPYLQYAGKGVLPVPCDQNGRSWPFADRENDSALAAYIKRNGAAVYLSVEFTSTDIAKRNEILGRAGLQEKQSPHELVCLLAMDFPFAVHGGADKAVARAVEVFCSVSEKIVDVM